MLGKKEKKYLISLVLLLFTLMFLSLFMNSRKPKLDSEPYLTQSRKILFLNTGGNMGLVKTIDGYVKKKNFLKSKIDEMTKESNDIPNYDIMEYFPPIDSRTINSHDWNKIANDINNEYYYYDAIIIIHDIETICYTASAISFMLENNDKPIIFTGSPISIHERNSNARDNLFDAISLATSYKIPEVIISYNGSIIRGCRATMSNNIIISPNFPLLGFQKNNNIQINTNLILKPSGDKFELAQFNPKINIIIVKIFPGITENYLKNTLNSQKNIHGIVIEPYGDGKIPLSEGFIETIADIIKLGVVVVQPTSKSTGINLEKLGLVSSGDMTIEASYTKLLFLLSNIKKPKIKLLQQLMLTNMRGEITS